MSISNTIQSIENHINKAYKGLENLGADLTNTDKNINNISAVLDTVYDNLPKVPDEGENVMLSPTCKGRLKLDIKGNMYQNKYEGYNLYNQDDLLNVTDWTKNVDGYYTGAVANLYNYYKEGSLVNNLKQNTQYAIQLTGYADSNDVNLRFRVFYDDDTREQSTSGSFTTTESTITLITNPTKNVSAIRFNYSNTGNIFIKNVQVDENSVIRKYEPFTNNQPSPNPDYPQDVKVVTGDNQIIIMNKNICNRANRSNANTIYARYENGGLGNTVTLSFKTDVTVEGVQIYPDGLSELAQTVNITANQRVSATFNLTDEQIKTAMSVSSPRFIINKTNAGWTSITEAQIENNSEFTGYIAHQEQAFTISLGSIELCKIGNYTDSIIKKSDGWYLHKEIEKKTLNGTESWSVQNATTFQFVCRGLNISKSVQMYCDKFVCYTSWQSISTPYFRSSTTNGQIWAELGRNTTLIDEATVAKWKAWLANNTPTLYYPLIEPVETKITDTNLINILNKILDEAKSYDEVTYIINKSTNDNAVMIVNVSALQGSTTYALNQDY